MAAGSLDYTFGMSTATAGYPYRHNEVVAPMDRNAVIARIQEGVVDEGRPNKGC